MKLYDKLITPITEVKYLSAENASRYRVIMRLFYINHENIQSWMTKDEVFLELTKSEGFEDYTIDQCLADLNQLVTWKNLIANQDTSQIRTIEEFRNKQYRYQLSDYSVEIERLTLKLENLEVEVSSLEPSRVDRLYHHLKEMKHIKTANDREIYNWFDVLMVDFIRINQNYQDYIKTLNSARADELMKTKEFLVYKDRLMLYLREFVIYMQKTGGKIAAFLHATPKEDFQLVLSAVSRYEESIPRLTEQVDYEQIYDNNEKKFYNLIRFFTGDGGVSEIDRLYDISDDIIRKMTRYASRISEMMSRGSHRKEQYRHIATLFSNCTTIQEAHEMSAYIFGVPTTMHLSQLPPKTTEDIHCSVYKQSQHLWVFEPHTKMVRKSAVREAPESTRLERELARIKIEEELREQEHKIDSLIEDHVIDFQTLPVIDERTRRTLMGWLSSALSQPNHQGKTNTHRLFYVDDTRADTWCQLKCHDGTLTMPAYKLIFKEEDDHEEH